MGLQIILILALLPGPAVTIQQTEQAQAPGQAVGTPLPNEQEYLIYQAVLQGMILQKKSKLIVIIAKTGTGYPPGMGAMTSIGGADRKKLMDAASEGTKNDFDAKNKERVRLSCDRLSLQIKCTALEDKAAYEGVPGGGDWSTFHEKYPNSPGVTLLSRVGFNSAADQALVYVANSCDVLCGAGYFVLLARRDGKWEIVEKAVLWVS